MLIKEEASGIALRSARSVRRRLRRRLRRRIHPLRRILRLAGRVLMLMLVAVGVWSLARGGPGRLLDVASSARRGVAIVGHWFDGVTARPRRLDLHVKFKNARKLAYDREQALEYGRIVQHEDSYVPAKVELADRTVKAKVRLKGDMLDHVDGDKWSLRVKVRGDEAVYGMRSFSIQDPLRSAFVYEWVFHELMRREGLIAPRYDFVDVWINGERKGIYAMEESFGKQMVEAHARREGPIVRFDESFQFAKKRPHASRILLAADVDAFESGKTDRDPKLRAQFEMARDLLDRFRRQELTVADVFDLELTARYFALLDLCTAHHAARWKNVRFYFNPVTTRLEPIPYNAYTARLALTARVKPAQWLGGQYRYGKYHVPEWMDAFFRDPEFYREYVGTLARVSDEAWLATFLREIDTPLRDKLRIIYRDDPTFVFSDEYLRKNGRMIRNAVRPMLPVSVVGRPELDRLDVTNPGRLAVELRAIVNSGSGTRHRFEPEPRRVPGMNGVPAEVNVTLPPAAGSLAGLAEGELLLVYRVVGMDEDITVPIRYGADPPALANLPQRMKATGEDVRKLKPLRFDEASRTITVHPGPWRIDETVILPPGYVVRADSEVSIDLREGASLISYSPLEFQGTADRPLVVHSGDGTGGGLIVLEAGETSRFTHVRFGDLGEPAEGLWTTTGAVTVYGDAVEIRHCTFDGGRSEDQLNIIRAGFLIEDSSFIGAASDALDVDFGHGRVEACRFVDSTNDAIDVSGSEVTVATCSAEYAGDKGLSAGESSRVQVHGFLADTCRIGLASKDLSHVTARDVVVRSCAVALAAYRKKPEYGPATITVDALTSEATTTLALVEKGSWIIRDGRREDGTRLHVYRTLEGDLP